MKLDGKRVDLEQLRDEMHAAGLPIQILGTLGVDEDGLPDELMMYEGGMPVELPPEAEPVVAAHDASKKGRIAAFETAEDAERLRLVNERARTDPAYAALADLALGKDRPQ